MENQQAIAMTVENANALLGYLSTKPFNEVHQIIDMIKACPTVNLVPDPAKGDAPTEVEQPQNRAVRRQMNKAK